MTTVFRRMAERWPSTMVAREKIGSFTGGVITPGHMANLDSRGEGPPRIIRIGRKAAYDVEDLICWLEDRAQEEIPKRPKDPRGEKS